MKQTLQLGAIVCLISFTVAVCLFLANLDRDLNHIDSLVIHSDKLVQQEAVELHGATQNLNAVLIQAALVTNEARLAAAEQRNYWKKTSEQTEKTVVAFRMLIDRTDRSLNDSVLPDLDATVRNINGNSAQSFSAVTQVANSLHAQLSDPQFKTIIGNLDQASGQLVVTSKNVSDATGSLASATHDIQVKVHDMTKPASFAVRVGQTLLGLAAQFGQIFAGFVR